LIKNTFCVSAATRVEPAEQVYLPENLKQIQDKLKKQFGKMKTMPLNTQYSRAYSKENISKTYHTIYHEMVATKLYFFANIMK